MCPNAYGVKDKWGDLPLAYIIWSEAPKDVLHFFFETHRRNEGKMSLDFSAVIKRLAKYASAEHLRRVIQAQRTYFPELVVDWQSIGAYILSELRGNRQFPFHEVVRVLLEASVSRRFGWMSLEHQDEIDYAIVRRRNDCSIRFSIFDQREYAYGYNVIQAMVIDRAWLYHSKLVETTTILELALWKMLLNEVLQPNQNIIITDDRSVREQIRSDSGNVFNVVISNVLSFL